MPSNPPFFCLAGRERDRELFLCLPSFPISLLFFADLKERLNTMKSRGHTCYIQIWLSQRCKLKFSYKPLPAEYNLLMLA